VEKIAFKVGENSTSYRGRIPQATGLTEKIVKCQRFFKKWNLNISRWWHKTYKFTERSKAGVGNLLPAGQMRPT